MYAYLIVTNYAISLILIRKKDRVQKPVYYISKSLQKIETHYLPLEKVVLAIVHARRKLLHYFQAHTMMVLTQLPLQALLKKLDYKGRIAKWGTMLRAYDVKYMPHTIIKGKVLADFVAEFTKGIVEKEEETLGVMVTSAIVVLPWEVYIDGAFN